MLVTGAAAEWDPRAMINGGDAANGASPLHLAAAVSHKEMVRGRQLSFPRLRPLNRALYVRFAVWSF